MKHVPRVTYPVFGVGCECVEARHGFETAIDVIEYDVVHACTNALDIFQLAAVVAIDLWCTPR